jgi:predicted DNA-binding transcriptional regulator AlpA
MNKDSRLIDLKVSDLIDLISESVATELTRVKDLLTSNVNKSEKELLTREEVSKLLKLSYTTLWKHDKTGILPAKKLGHKVFYLRADVMNKLNNIGLAI